MKPSILGVSALAVVLLGSVTFAADEAAKPQSPSTSAESARSDQAKEAQSASASEGAAKPQARTQARSPRLTKPWRDLGSLSDEQKKQIADIHRKAVQDKNVIEEREKADIMALLNDQQKGELKTMLDKEAADRKARAGNRPAANGSAPSSPASGSSASGKVATDDKGAKTKTGE